MRYFPVPGLLGAILVVIAGACAPAAPASGPASAASASAQRGTAIPNPPVSVPSDATDPRVVLQRFFEVTAADDLSFHLDQDALLKFPGSDSRPSLITYDLDVSGPDTAGEALIEGQTIEVVVVGQDAWIRQGEAPWTKTTRAEAGGDDIVDVFRYVGGIDDLEFVNLRSSNSEDWYRYRAVRRLPYITGAMRQNGGTGELTSLDLYLLESGIPRQMEFAFEATQGSATGEISVEGRTQIVVTRWGEPVTIAPPE